MSDGPRLVRAEALWLWRWPADQLAGMGGHVRLPRLCVRHQHLVQGSAARHGRADGPGDCRFPHRRRQDDAALG